MRAELLGEFGLGSAAADRGDLEAHVASVLDPEVAEPADAEHRDEIASLRRRIAQSAERREAGAEQRRRVDRRESIRHRHEPAGLGDHHLRVASILLHAGVGLVLTAHEVAGAAGDAVSAAAAEKPHADALADCPAFDAFTERIDPTDRLVAGHTRPFDGEHPFHRAGVRMANAAGLDADADMTWRRIKQRLLGQLQLAWTDGLYCAIGRSGLRHFRLRALHLVVFARTHASSPNRSRGQAAELNQICAKPPSTNSSMPVT